MLNNTQCIVLFVHVSCHYLNGLSTFIVFEKVVTVHPRDREIVGSIDTFYFCSFKFVSFFILSSQRFFFPSEKLMYYERDQIKYLISFRKMVKKNSNNNNNNQRMSRRENVPTHTLNNSQEPPLAKIEKYFSFSFF